MILYAESSAVLAWLLDEPTAPAVRQALAQAELVLASELTPIECDRALIRLVAWNEQTQDEAEEARDRLFRVTAHWAILQLAAPVLARARRPFPVEPIRTLDALHLASALGAREVDSDLALLSLDTRVRDCGRALGFQILPDDVPAAETEEPAEASSLEERAEPGPPEETAE